MRLMDQWGSGEASPLMRAVEEWRAAGLPVADLVTANPQEHGFTFPSGAVERALAEGQRERALYSPDPRGFLDAREAVAEWHGGGATAEDVVLTPGTSLAYWYAFRLLCEPGDEVLCPSPTYPLFEDLATLAGARVRHYHLAEAGGRWSIDPEEVAFQATARTRVLVLVAPHNPTGCVPPAETVAALCAVARERGMAIVLDEVFRTILHGDGAVARPSEHGAPLCITLNGLSKMASLPGVKAGWMVAEGDEEPRRRLLAALEYLSDTFLPVNEAVQGALPVLLHQLGRTGPGLALRWRRRMAECRERWRAAGLAPGAPDGGVYLPVKVGTEKSMEALAVGLVREAGVLVHPGGLYRLEGPWLVTTVANADAEAIARAGAWLAANG